MKHSNNTREEHLAHALDLALELKRKGVPADEVLSRFPEFQKELAPLLSTMGVVGKSMENIVPRRALLSRILTGLEEGVTDAPMARLERRGYGRTSFIGAVKNAMSTMRLIVPAGAVILFLLVFGIGRFIPNEPEQLSLNVDELEDEVRGLEAMRGEGGIIEDAKVGTREKTNITAPAPATLGAPVEPSSPAIEQAAVASEGNDLESDFSEFDEFNANDAEIDQAFSEF